MDVPGIRTLLNPFAAMSAKVEGWTGGLFQDPSSGVASSVFPKFHPGFNAANAADAEIGVNAAVHDALVVAVAMLDELKEVDGVVIGLEVIVVLLRVEEDLIDVLKVVADEDEPVPGIHCE